MGIILSRLRKKKSAVEVLEKLENDIKEIEENGANAQRKYKKITKSLLVYSVALYVLCGVFFYFQYSSTLQEKLLYLVPLAISPLLLYIVKGIISWYFVRLINKNQTKLREMKKEKKRILDEVMDTETYKVAKEILEKFSAETVSKPKESNMQITPVRQFDDKLRKRVVNNTSNAPNVQALGTMFTNYNRMHSPQPPASTLTAKRSFQGPVNAGNAMVCLPAPILPLNRGYVDRVVEYLIGDGPNNRYALICSKCHSHNGMALKEEFEYIGFKCCYCYNYNPARKIRPEAPKLGSPLAVRRSSESDSESKTSGENSDVEPKPQIEFDTLIKSDDVNSRIVDVIKDMEKREETNFDAEENGNTSGRNGDKEEEEKQKEEEKEDKRAEDIIKTQNGSNESDPKADSDEEKS